MTKTTTIVRFARAPAAGMVRRFLRFSLAGLAALLATGCSGKITREATALVLAVDGSAFLEESSPHKVKAGSSFKTGETLRTTGDGTVAILLLPGALLQLGPNSAAKVKELSIGKDGNATDEAMSRKVRLEVREGTADLLVQFESQPGGWAVETPNGILSTKRPGTCRLALHGQETRIDCLRGVFEFLAKGETAAAEITAGSFQEWPLGKRTPSPSELDARGQEEITESLEMERKLLNLQEQIRVSPFPWRHLGENF